MSGSIASFVEEYLPEAESVSSETGLPVDYVLGQSGLETGWGTSTAATALNNFFGISPGGSLASYSDPDTGWSAYAELVNSTPGYSSAGGAGNALGIGNAMQAAGYSTNPNYGTEVAGATSAVDSVLNALGLNPSTGSAAGTAAGTAAETAAGTAATGSTGSAASVFSPASWISALGGYAARGGLILVGAIFLLGAVYLFGVREFPAISSK